jgi:hypothetical protein
MGDAWKSIERLAAELLGGDRAWDSEEDCDVLVPSKKNPEWNVEVKWRLGPTFAQAEAWLALNQTKCEKFDPPLKNALLVKRKAGRGKKTPWLLVMRVET